MSSTCKRCLNTFARKQQLVQHLRRKVPCTPISEDHKISLEDLMKEVTSREKNYHCNTCKKSFSSRQTKSYHQKHSCKEKQMPKNDEDLTTIMHNLDLKSGITIYNFNNCKFVAVLAKNV